MIVIHIGPHKTGTSTLQGWLSANREPLKQLGYLYPGISPSHNGLAGQIRRSGFDGAQGWGKWLAIQRDVADSSHCPHVILSAEGFSRLKGTEVAQMAAAFGRDEVRVVCYLRKPWDRKASAHTQHVKRLMPVRILSRLQTFNGNVSTVEEQDEGYLGMLERWEQAFGLGRLVVRVLEKEQLHDGDLVSDFLHVIGLPTPREHGAYVKVANVNEMPGRDTLRVLHAVDLAQLDGISYAARRDRIAEPILAGAESLGWNKVRAHLLSAELARRFESAMAEQHAHIARRYLGREDGFLFAPVGHADHEADALDLQALPKESLIKLIGAAVEAAAGAASADAPGDSCDDKSRLLASLVTSAAGRLGFETRALVSSSGVLVLEHLRREQLVALLVETLIGFHGGREALEQDPAARTTSDATLPGDLSAGLEGAGEWFRFNAPSAEYERLAQQLDQRLEKLGRVLRKRGFAESSRRSARRSGLTEAAS